MVTVPTQLPDELEAIFRSGGSFDSGFELMAALQLTVSVCYVYSIESCLWRLPLANAAGSLVGTVD